MSLRFILLAAACVQLALAQSAGSVNWHTVAAPARTAWEVPAVYSGSPSWYNAPAGSSIYGAVAPWKTPAPIASFSFPAVNVREEHPWGSPAVAPSSAATGSPAVISPVESWWTGPSSHTWASPANPGSLAVAAAPSERREPQLPAPLQLPTPPQLPAPLQLPAPAQSPSSAKVSASSHSSNHPLPNPGPIQPSFGPGIAPYAPVEVHSHPLQSSGAILSTYSPGLPPYAPIEVPKFPLQNPNSFQPVFFSGLAPYAPLQVPYTPSGPQYGPGIAPYAAILVPIYAH